MTRVFMSHSSEDNHQALALKQWLIEQEPGLMDEIFLDLDPHNGIRPGERWKQALQKANTRCEAVICLLSAHWQASHECAAEYRSAEISKKTIVCARLEPSVSREITSEWQRCDLFGAGPTTTITIDGGEQLVFLTEGLQRLLRGLRALGIGAEYFPWPPLHDPDRAPYRGWAPLDEADAAVFFGRDGQIVRGLDELRGIRHSGVESLLVILGPSGAGKSSFLRAGLLPRLRRDDRQFLPLDIVRPERAVLTGELGLACAIHNLRATLDLPKPLLGEIKVACLASEVERLRGWLTEARQAALTRLVEVQAETPAPTLVLPLDQGEELFSADAGAEAPRFLKLLAALLRHDDTATPGLIAAVTIRADRYEPMQTAPELANVRSVVFAELRPMPPAEFREVITGPARRATIAGRPLRIEPALIDRLLAESAHGADTLPLLALTLERLYRDYGADGNLTLSEYQKMGGMSSVVQTEIDTLLSADPTARQTQLEQLHDAFIPWLATINPDNNQPMRRLARWSDLPTGSHTLLDALVGKRLLVRDERDGHVVVEVALESLLRQWRELAGWLCTEGEDLKNADTLERAAADWHASTRNEAWLLQGTRLADAEALAEKPRFQGRLAPFRDFLLTSREREENQKDAELQAAREKQKTAEAHTKRLRMALVLVVALAVFAIFWVVTARKAEHEAEARTREATALRLVSEAQTMLAGARHEGDAQALQQLLAAQAIATTPDESALLDAVNARRGLLKIIEQPAPVNSVAFSPDGQHIASGSEDGTIQAWDATTGKPVGTPITSGHGPMRSVAFSPDGQHIASGSEDGTIQAWDATTGKPVGAPITGHQLAVSDVAFSPDGQRIASGSEDGTVQAWDATTGKPVGAPITSGHDAVWSVAFSPDGQRIASGSEDGTIQAWDATTGKPVGAPMTSGHDAVWSVAFSPDGQQILSGGWGDMGLWDAATGQPVGPRMTSRHDRVWSVAFSPDGRHIVTGGVDDMVRVWDAATGQPIGQPMTGHQGDVKSVAFSPDGQHIVTGGDDKTLRVWDAAIGQPITAGTGAESSLALSPDGQHIVTGGVDDTVRVWDTTTGQPIGEPLTGHQGDIKNVAFSPDGQHIVTDGDDDTVRVWDTTTGQPIGQPLTAGQGAATSLAFSPDGEHIVTGSDHGTVRVWDPTTGQPIGQPLTAGQGTVTSLAFSPDGEHIVTGSDHGTVRVWDPTTGQPITPPMTGDHSNVSGLAFSPDGQRVASGSSGDDTVRVWDATTGQPIGQPLTGHQGPVNNVAFTPDGQHIVSGGDDETVRVWDATTGQPIGQPLTAGTGAVTSVAVSPDGLRIVSVSDDGTVQAWAGPSVWRDELCAKLTQNMSHQQWHDWVSPVIDYHQACPGLPIPESAR